MNQNIPACLDLNKSLENFKAKISPALELKDITSWSGRNIKERESVIRNAALVLAGESIALLLYSLAKSEQVQEKAISETQGWWNIKTRRHGKCRRQVTTVGNVVVALDLPYVVERRPKTNGQNKLRNQGFCPFLRWLGMSEGITPLVLSTIAESGTMSSSFATARSMLNNWGITMSLKRIERLTYYFGSVGLSLRHQNVFHLRNGTLANNSVLKGQRVVIAVDGGRTRIRINKKGRKNAKTHRHGYVGEWKEPKLLTIYTVNEQGKKNKSTDIPITNDGTYKGYEALLEILEMHLIHLGINQAAQVLLIGDAAEWIWNHIPPLLKRLISHPQVYQLLDFYHVTSHLKDFADAAFTQKSESAKWFNQARKLLKKGKITTLIDSMKLQSITLAGEPHQIMMAQINYLVKADMQGLLNYAGVAAANLPIGSGAIESLIRQVVNLRLKGNGKFWLKQHAEILLHSRCQSVSGNWNNFCDSILTCFTYPVLTE